VIDGDRAIRPRPPLGIAVPGRARCSHQVRTNTDCSAHCSRALLNAVTAVSCGAAARFGCVDTAASAKVCGAAWTDGAGFTVSTSVGLACATASFALFATGRCRVDDDCASL